MGGDRGIIPARAGFTTRRGMTRWTGGDHPRSRGVYRDRRDGNDAVRGSSPLARGLQPLVVGRRVHRGIIPARAGFTPSSGKSGYPPSDHPRSRGVYDHDLSDDRSVFGSSPLARGLLLDRVVQLTIERIIPARAGFTTRRGTTRWTAGDHPRSRGVYVSAAGEQRVVDGSSPLARGLRRVVDLSLDRVRIIPARAGFTHEECH